MADMKDDLLFWKEKCESSEQNLLKLKKLAHKAVADHEDLQRKYDQNQKQYDELTVRLKDTEEKLHKLQQVLEPVYNEYSELEWRFALEKDCRDKAEEYASKVVKQNKDLKRQSQFLIEQLGGLSVVDIPIDTIESEAEVESQTQHFSESIDKLQDELVQTKIQLKQATESLVAAEEQAVYYQQQYMQERDNHEQTKSSLQQHQSAIKQYNRVSFRAYGEFQEIKDLYEKERKLRLKAEQYANEMMQQKNAVVRESSVLLAEASADKQLEAALTEIENLTLLLETERNDHGIRIGELESTIQESSDVKSIEEYEYKLQASLEENERLQKLLEDSEKWQEKLNKEVHDLTAKLHVAEEKLRPPPPPPPPPPPTGFLKPLKDLISKNKKSRSPSSDKPSDPKQMKYKDAIDEMMERIRSGRPLRQVKSAPAQKESAPEERMKGGAMEELNSILTTLGRRRTSAGEIVDIPPSAEADTNNNSGLSQHSEFEQVFLKVRGNENVKKNLSPITEEDGSSEYYVSHL